MLSEERDRERPALGETVNVINLLAVMFASAVELFHPVPPQPLAAAVPDVVTPEPLVSDPIVKSGLDEVGASGEVP